MNRYKQRMYGLVPYNISPIQQGIQFGHAVVEYGLTQTQQDPTDTELSPYSVWSFYDKTFVILNGGTTNTSHDHPGTLNQHVDSLTQLGIKASCFYEPDLGDQLTAVVFLLDERIWDKEKYPDYDDRLNNLKLIPGTDWAEIVYDIPQGNYYEKLFGDDTHWILELRDFLSQFRLA